MVRAIPAAAILLGGSLVLAACAATEPAVATSSAYLRQAQTAAQAHDATTTLAALQQAEGAWMYTSAAQGNPCMNYDRTELRAIGYARDSVKQARWGDARHYIRQALANVAAPG